jgi:phage gp36-like protein
MAFTIKADIQKAIKADMLSELLDGDETVVISSIDEAEAKAREYLSGRFDVATEFAKTGTARHQLLVTYCADIAIFNIWRYIDPVGIPKPRVDAYNEAMEWLKGAMKGTIPTTLTPVSEGDQSGGSLYFNSNDKRQNQY